MSPRSDDRMLTPAALRRERMLVADLLIEPLARIAGRALGGEEVAGAIEAFHAAWETRPIRDNPGGSGFNDALSLFVVARILKPDRVVELGTHRGLSAWLFARACPGAAIESFDIDHGTLVHREPAVTYRLGDWSEVEGAPDLSGGRALVFLDDHVSHARRLDEARTRGCRWALVDDNLPAHALFATGAPPVPTVAMLCDPDLAPGASIGWVRNGRERSWTATEEELARGRAAIARVVPLPDLSAVTFRPRQSGLTFVEIAPPDEGAG